MTEKSEAASVAVREPQQERSKAAWRRILSAGRRLLEQGGAEAVSILAICEAANVAPTAIYARVDGIAGLFSAIYDDGMADVVASYTSKLNAAEKTPPHSKERVVATVKAVVETFSENSKFLDPIIVYSLTNPLVNNRGAIESRSILKRVTALLDQGDEKAANHVARMLHQECVFRSMYGPRWLTESTESLVSFERRLWLMAEARLGLL